MTNKSKKFIILITICLCWMTAQPQQVFNINKTDKKQVSKQKSITPQLKTLLGETPKQYRVFELNPYLKNFSQENVQDTILLDFFNDKQYKAVVKNVKRSYDGIVGITMQITDDKFGYCFISIAENKVHISVELPLYDEFFSTVKINSKLYLVEQKLSDIQNNILPEAEPLPAPTGYLQKQNDKEIMELDILQPSNDTLTIDIIIAYTPIAEQWAATHAGSIDLLIDQALLKANLSLQNSLTNVTLNVVHKHLVDYTETGVAYIDVLDHITVMDDQLMDEIHLLREQYNADMVSLFAEITGAGGVAWLLSNEYGSPRYAFSVIRVAQANSYSFVHELGHNMGCGHHIWLGGGRLYPYSGGWRGVTQQGTKYSTVMTYETGNYPDPSPHPRIPYFSDPNILFEGVYIGNVDSADNALTIRKTKVLVEAYSTKLNQLNGFLSDIIVSEGALTPEFDPTVREYKVYVGNAITNISVTGIAGSSLASVTGNVNNYALSVGDNVITIHVYPASGYSQTYTVTIVRKDLPMGIIFPTTTAVIYDPAQTLSTIPLNNDGFGNGVFAWAAPGSVPTVLNSGYNVVFTPNDSNTYDNLLQSVSLTVYQADQTITIPPLPDKKHTDAPFNINASVTSGLPLDYSSGDASIAQISPDGTITILDSGTVIFTVSQVGDDNYKSAIETASLTIRSDTAASITSSFAASDAVLFYPNPVRASEFIYMKVNDNISLTANAALEIYNPAGSLIESIPVTDCFLRLQTPAQEGVYVYVLKLNDVSLTRQKVILW